MHSRYKVCILLFTLRTIVGPSIMGLAMYAIDPQAVHLDWSELIVFMDAQGAQFAVVQQPHGRSYTASFQ
jgi:hypothetical protein